MSKQTKVKLPHLCSPITYDEYLDKILLAIYKVGKAATSKEMVVKDSSLEDNRCTGRAASFISYLGLVKGERSPFDLSPSGREIAIALMEGKEKVALNLWRQTLKAHSLYSELQQYIEDQGGKRGTSLGFAEHLRKLAGKDWNTRYLHEGGKRICVLFANKGLLEFNRDEDSISFPTTTPPATTETPTDETVTTQVTSQAPTDIVTTSTLPFVVNITIEAKDADSIKQVINLVRELTGRK
jgi:hypothetical protein